MRICFENRRNKLLTGALLAVLCPASCMLLGYSIKAGMVLMVLSIAVAGLRLEISRKWLLYAVHAVLFLAMPVASMVLGFPVQEIYTLQLTPVQILLNLGIILCLALAVLLISSNIRFSFAVGLLAPILLAMINAYVYAFRGIALTPTDVFSIRTAANVAAEYDLTPTPNMLYALLFAAVLILAQFCVPRIKLVRNLRTIGSELAGIAVLVCALLPGFARQNAQYWQNEGAVRNGIVLNFVMQMKDVYVERPEGYSKDAVEEMAVRYQQADAPVSAPDIIVIMDESFADFRVFGQEDFPDAPIMPYMDALTEDTVRGYLNTSVFGGSTANTEYEFLSGNTMAFLPQGSIAYQQYYSGDSWSLLDVMNAYGYDCVAMHPYHANGWMRDTVYTQMGFEELYFLPDFPQEQMVRGFVGDQEMFEFIINCHEQHDDQTPLFLFGVTMQNHGGYGYKGADFQPTVSVEGYPMAEQYLSLAQMTDRAVEYLIEHYKTVERDTVIVFFGDHMPNVEPAFYEELNGGAFDTLDEQMKKQMVPFFIWANFDIEERQIPCSSVNYLPLYTLEAAGLPLPPYMQFLKETEAVIPAITAYGYYSPENRGFLPLAEASGAEAEALERYAVLQYNDLFDDKNRNEYFFGK